MKHTQKFRLIAHDLTDFFAIQKIMTYTLTSLMTLLLQKILSNWNQMNAAINVFFSFNDPINWMDVLTQQDDCCLFSGLLQWRQRPHIGPGCRRGREWLMNNGY